MGRNCLLGDVLTLQRGYDLPSHARREGAIPIVSSSGVTGTHAEAKVAGPGVVTGRYGTLGEIHFVPGAFWPLNTTLYVRDFKGNDPRFVAYFLQTLNFANRSAAAAVPGINRNDLHRIPVHCPDLHEQHRIASILSAYDDLIENNTRRIAILEQMARRIYEEWFARFRFPGHEGVRMVESELGLVPEGWETVRMEDVCARITDGSHYSPKSIEAGKPMASVKDMHDWGINVGTCRQIAEDEYEKLVRADCKPRLDDVLIAKDGSYLKHTFVVDQEIDLVILSSIAILRPNGRMQPNQLAMYLRLPKVASRMKGYVSGVAIPRIVLRDFRQFLVLLPPADVQRAWAAHCDPMLRLCRNLVRKNENLSKTRDLLLPKLISGELDVSTTPEPEALAA
jgi:type I restriction enzyme S subunit